MSTRIETLAIYGAASQVGIAADGAASAQAELDAVLIPVGAAETAAAPRLDDAYTAVQTALQKLGGLSWRVRVLADSVVGSALAYEQAEAFAAWLFGISFPVAGEKSLAAVRARRAVIAAGAAGGRIAEHGDDTAAILGELEALPPEGVAAVWAGLPLAQRNRLAHDCPEAIGNMGGVSLDHRARANQIAAARMAEEGLDALPASTRTTVEQIASGRIQAVQFRPERGEVVQMIGQPGDETQHVVNYAPGTFATAGDLAYDEDGRRDSLGAVDAIAREHSADTVAFIYVSDCWADEIAGMTFGDDPEGLHGQVEADDPVAAMNAGRVISEFTQGALAAEPSLAEAELAGMGHSFGHSAIAGSDMQGVDYDAVVSLAGSNAPPGWAPTEGTRYVNIQYSNDILSPAQPLVYGGAGTNPDTSPLYEQHSFSEVFVDDEVRGMTGAMTSHNRIVNGPEAGPVITRADDWWNQAPVGVIEVGDGEPGEGSARIDHPSWNTAPVQAMDDAIYAESGR